jgi:predicted RNase H-like HicB family nuclease
MPAIYYPAVIDRSSSAYGVTFPDFPGCIAAGASVNEAAINAEAALALHVEGLIKDKDALPEPSRLDDIEEVEGADDVARLLIRVEAPVKVERVLVSLDANLLRAIDAVAPNRSAFMAEAARAQLTRVAPAPVGTSNDSHPWGAWRFDPTKEYLVPIDASGQPMDDYAVDAPKDQNDVDHIINRLERLGVGTGGLGRFRLAAIEWREFGKEEKYQIERQIA